MDVHDPATTYLHFGTGPEITTLPVTDEFWATIDERTDLDTGRLMTGSTVDADWSTWEMHPHGDELVMVTEGSVRFWFDDGSDPEHPDELTVSAPNYLIVPAGTWHTADTLGPARLLILTWGDGTTHRPR